MINDSWWMPFTNNRAFQENPRMFERAEGCFLYTSDEREVLDITAGLWCMNLGHGQKHIADAVQQQIMQLDFAPSFQFGNPVTFRFAERLIRHTPEGINKVFFTNDGSSSIDTAIKMAYAYQRARGKGSKQRFVSRLGGYHGIHIGGTSLQGMPNNRKGFPTLDTVDFLPSLWDVDSNAFSRGLPQHGAEKADALLDIIELRGADSIAAVVVEPIIGAGGMMPPPQGYLERLRQLCDEHDILLVFDEVITGFGRTGSAFAATEFGVTPDIMTTAKGITGGTVPMGAVFTGDHIYQTIVHNAPDNVPEFFHGTTYSGTPIAAAAGNACLDLYEEKDLFQQSGGELIEYWEDALHSLREQLPMLIDIRNYGLLGGVTFAAHEQAPAGMGPLVHQRCYENGLLCRAVGHHMVMSPPLTIKPEEIDVFIERFIRSVNEVYASLK